MTTHHHGPQSPSQHVPVLPQGQSQGAQIQVQGVPMTFNLAEFSDLITSPEISTTVAVDGSYVETSSGQAARDIKKRYDQLFGVGPSVRTPYAITAFVSQHGKQMYRITHREAASAAPASSMSATAEEVDDPHHSQQQSQGRERSKRRSRLSMHLFKGSPNPASSSSLSPPPPLPTNIPLPLPNTLPASRKLRKTRSNSDMQDQGPIIVQGPTVPNLAGRTHSHSVTSVSMSGARQGSPLVPVQPLSLPLNLPLNLNLNTSLGPAHAQPQGQLFPPPTTQDVFAQVLHLQPPQSSFSSSSSSSSSSAVVSPVLASSLSLSHLGHTQRIRPAIFQPFGSGVFFQPPRGHGVSVSSSKGTGSSTSVGGTTSPPREKGKGENGESTNKKLRVLREMQSFESARTVRHRKSHSTVLDPDSSISSVDELSSPSLSSTSSSEEEHSDEDDLDDSEDESSHLNFTLSPASLRLSSHNSTEVFNVLQTYRGLPRFDKLDDVLFSPDPPGADSDSMDHGGKGVGGEPVTIRLSLAADQSAAPKDDPRFVIWGEVVNESKVFSSGGGGPEDSATDISSAASAGGGGTGGGGGALSIAKRRASRSTAGSSFSGGVVGSAMGSSVSISGSVSGSSGAAAASSRLSLSTHSHAGGENLLNTSHAGASGLHPNGTRLILAATIERWIAQLTSDLNYDELLDFFLTYRTYISPTDLCNLLIGRFHWALQRPPEPGSVPSGGMKRNGKRGKKGGKGGRPRYSAAYQVSETIRRIVRVRTFVAIRYWLVTFFTVDFVPNRDLRLLLADWLNTLRRDEVLRKFSEDGYGIVKRLIKVAKECQQAHIRSDTSKQQKEHRRKASQRPRPSSSTRPSTSADSSTTDAQEDDTLSHLLGKSFAQATRKKKDAIKLVDDDESDLDLDFLPEDVQGEARSAWDDFGVPGTAGAKGPASATGTGGDAGTSVVSESTPANAHFALKVPGVVGGVGLARPSSVGIGMGLGMPKSSFNILQRTEHAPGPSLLHSSSATQVSFSSRDNQAKGQGQEEHEHSALSRAFVRTVGRLGRWRRALGTHSRGGTALGGGGGTSRPTTSNGVGLGLGLYPNSSLSLSTPLNVPSAATTIPAGHSVRPMASAIYLGKGAGLGMSNVPTTIPSTISAPTPGAVSPPAHVGTTPSATSTPSTTTPSTSSTSTASTTTTSPSMSPLSLSISVPIPLLSPLPLPPVELGDEPLIPPGLMEMIGNGEGQGQGKDKEEEAPEVKHVAMVEAEAPEQDRGDADPRSHEQAVFEAVSFSDSSSLSDVASVSEASTGGGGDEDPQDQHHQHQYFDEVDQSEGRPESFRSSSTDSFGEPLTSDGPLAPMFDAQQPGQTSGWGMGGGLTSHWGGGEGNGGVGGGWRGQLGTRMDVDIVSLDEFDSERGSLASSRFEHENDDEVDIGHPPGLGGHGLGHGLGAKSKKLPMRKDFEFVRRSQVSSMGIVSQESMRDSVSSSVGTGTSASSGDAGEDTNGGPRPLARWQIKTIQRTFEEMSNDEAGDVDAALRRLEGQINPEVLQEKADKVDGWVKTMQERMAKGDYEYEASIAEEREGFFDEVDDAQSVSEADVESVAEREDAETKSWQDEDTSQHPQSPPQQIAIPTAPLIPQLPLAHSQMHPKAAEPILVQLSQRPHRSFVLNYPTDVLAEHFALIDRELFMSVKFEELVTDGWMEVDEIHVLDWGQYLKERAVWKAEGVNGDKTTPLAALRARFNLVVAWVVSEVVLTQPGERSVVVGKFVRIAWKSYSINNFHTLTAIITALSQEPVQRAMKRPGMWNRIGSLEARMLRDLKQFVSAKEEFRFMRQAVDAIAEAKPGAAAPSSVKGATGMSTGATAGSSSHSSSVAGDSSSSGNPPKAANAASTPGCIPFIGIYLCQLSRIHRLPALIDPTAPYTQIGIDPYTTHFEPPSHPEVFSALQTLPDGMSLEPLVNVHKQRLIAGVVRAVVAGQHLASRVVFGSGLGGNNGGVGDRKVFQRCLKLRGLEGDVVSRVLAAYGD